MKYALLAILAIAPTCLMAQTTDLAPRALYGSASLPATCSPPQIMIDTAAAPGSQVYVCTATNTWTAQGSGAATLNFPTASASGATATFFANCVSSPYCNIQQAGIGTIQINQSQTGTAPSSGSATAYLYATRSASCVVSAPNAVTVSAGCSYVAGSAFPAGSIPLATLAYAAGTWGTVTNLVPAVSAYEDIATTTGVAVISDDGKTKTIGTDTSTASVGTGTANYVARWNGNSYTLGTGMMQDDGTKVGVGGAADTGYTFQAKGNTTGTVFSGVSNTDATNVGSASTCWIVNGATANTCVAQVGTASGGQYNLRGTGDFVFLNGVGTEGFRIYNSGDIKLASITPPTCDSAHGGMFAYQHTNGTTKDVVEVCAQDVSGVYAWRAIY